MLHICNGNKERKEKQLKSIRNNDYAGYLTNVCTAHLVQALESVINLGLKDINYWYLIYTKASNEETKRALIGVLKKYWSSNIVEIRSNEELISRSQDDYIRVYGYLNSTNSIAVNTRYYLKRLSQINTKYEVTGYIHLSNVLWYFGGKTKELVTSEKSIINTTIKEQ